MTSTQWLIGAAAAATALLAIAIGKLVIWWVTRD